LWSGSPVTATGRSLTMSTSTAFEGYQPVMSEAEQTTLLRGPRRLPRPHPRRLHVGSAPVHRLVLAASTPPVRGSPRRNRVLRPRARDRGKSRATVARRLCTIVGLYRYAEEEGVIEHSPAVHIRRPRIGYESHVAHLDRNELGSILVTVGLSSQRDHALVSLLALNGLRSRRRSAPTSKHSGSNADTAPSRCCARAASW
jgi:integrase